MVDRHEVVETNKRGKFCEMVLASHALKRISMYAVRPNISILICALILGGAPSCAFIELQDRPTQSALTQLFVGEWTGSVSWTNSGIESGRKGSLERAGREARDALLYAAFYVWCVDPDGAFTSGRRGRGQDGHGAWTAKGTHLTLRYVGGFRYEGEVVGDEYEGVAYNMAGKRFGRFGMRRTARSARATDGPCGV